MLGESLRERFGERPEVPIRHDAIKLLASDTRLSILKMLDQRRMTVSELARALNLNKSTVHEHLGKLVDGGLLRRDSSDQREWVYYELTKTARYVLQPSSARFVLLMGSIVTAGLVFVAFLHLVLSSGQTMLVVPHDEAAPAGEAHEWLLDISRPGVLGTRQAAEDPQLFLLSPIEAAEYQRTGSLPHDADPIGPEDGLRHVGPGRFAFRAALEPGTHYVLAKVPGDPGGLAPLRAAPVQVAPQRPSVMLGVDQPRAPVEVRFQGQPVSGGLLQALDDKGREVAQVPVVGGRAVVEVPGPSDAITFRYMPAAPGSTFAPAEGLLRAATPRVAIHPPAVPLGVASEVRVVLDDPVAGPREGASLALVGADGRSIAAGLTNETGGQKWKVTIMEPGDLVLKAGPYEVGRIEAKPGLRAWTEPGPHWEGEPLRVRSLHLGKEPEAVRGATVLVDGRPVGTTDAEGWFTLTFDLGGHYTLEMRRGDFVAGATSLDILPRTGFLLPPAARAGFEALAPRPALARAEPAPEPLQADGEAAPAAPAAPRGVPAPALGLVAAAAVGVALGVRRRR